MVWWGVGGVGLLVRPTSDPPLLGDRTEGAMLNEITQQASLRPPSALP